ncbi:sensor domain-containing diguanylate cyclase [Yersinia nurmii]|uniref:Diguanylate cyclase/phosphodiesterase domain-containing protein n=1 Tax=Yersinia nurmii TaxID=685706 RepID=A0AAW7KAT2_9GAMM|nr:sensor domain-containing diguanylate cyclase [Yersinia nurmii]MDN0089345.1 sensor domain-containing diguanylate cyclase [Yersinia nurmii]CNE18139.1 diguanylate cyclase/phosphodiesterase domain-containing protein [Yersinia nurmii]
MQTPPKPPDESARIATLRAYNILDTSPEERFDRITRLAKRLFNVPIALISLVDVNRQWFKSSVGLAASETSRDISFCGHAILEEGILMVPDALTDQRFCDNPLVIDAPGIRFYAGCPLVVPNGSKLGTLCLIDLEPRSLDETDQQLLCDLAKMAEQEIAAVQLATIDELTQLTNRRGFEILAQHALTYCVHNNIPASVVFFDLNNFKAINDTFGHAEGDKALMTFADELQLFFSETDIVARLGGDEFVALLTASGCKDMVDILSRFKIALEQRNRRELRGYNICFSVGYANCDFDKFTTIKALLAAADSSMYTHKLELRDKRKPHPKN